MKAGIMQPYFFPYLGYLSLIKQTDIFILLDTVQFIRHGWIERNRILKPDDGWQYIQVPIIKLDGRNTLIKDVSINNKENWKNRILSQLQHYKKKAPYYHQVILLLNDIFSDDFEDIASLNQVSLTKICSFLGLEKNLKVFSKMNLQIDEVDAPDEWALNICKALGNIEEYWNPPGGQSFFDISKYQNAQIDIRFHSVNLTEYNQKRLPFESGLSVIDVLMFNSIEEVNRMLDNYNLI